MVRCFKVLHFFSPAGTGTGMQSLTQLLREEDGVKIELYRVRPRKRMHASVRVLAELSGVKVKESRLELLGEGRVPLEQFRSAFVKLIDTFVPLGGGKGKSSLGGNAEVKISIGMDRK